MDFRQFYNDEKYLFEDVGPKFRATGTISVMDFEMLLSWKSTRPGDAHPIRLMRIVQGTYADAVAAIAADIHGATDHQQRLKILLTKWQFYLPTAAAILTVLYPEFFTMYDVRVCEQTGTADWSNRNFSEKLWQHYCEFKDKVNRLTPDGMDLRDKDRYLMGKSTYEQRERKLARLQSLVRKAS